MISNNLKLVLDQQIKQFKTLRNPTVKDVSKKDILFTIKNGEVKFETGGFEVDPVRVNAVHSEISRLNIDDIDLSFILHTDDVATEANEEVKTLCFSKLRRQKFVTIPNLHIMIGGVNGYLNQVKQFDVEYHKKIQQSLFCGSPTGSDIHKVGSRLEYASLIMRNGLARDNLCILSTTPILNIQQQLMYKYLVNIDGYSCSWDRIYWQLYSNSLVFYYNRNKEIVELHHELLKENEHYVAVCAESIQSNIEHFNKSTSDDERRKIIQNGKDFIREYFSSDNNSISNIINYILINGTN